MVQDLRELLLRMNLARLRRVKSEDRHGWGVMASEHALTIGDRPLPDLSGLGRGLNILVVEDDDDDALLIDRILSSDQRVDRVTRVVDGENALEKLGGTGKWPDLILVDINMPRCDGFEFLSQLREIEGRRNTPVVVLTSSSHARDYHRALMSKANAFATKPNTFEEFSVVLRKLVKQMIWDDTLPPLLTS